LKSIVLRNGRVLSPEGSWNTASVHITGGRISAVGDDVPAPANVSVIDMESRWIIPGLIDAHVHMCLSPDMGSDGNERWLLIGVRNARTYLRAGVTTVRDVGAPAGLSIHLARAIDTGLIPGPRIIACGQHIAMTGGHLYWFGREADGEAEVRKAVREQLRAGAKVIKFMASGGAGNADDHEQQSELSEREMAAGVAEARRAGVRTAAHAHTAEAISAALRAGVDTIEHATYLTDQVLDLLVDMDAAVIPTVAVYESIAVNEQLDEGYRRVGQRVTLARPPYFEAALKRGVVIGVGTDASVLFPAGQIVAEMESMAALGMTNWSVLHAATSVNASLLGLERDLGSIEPGKLADLVVLQENPLDSLNNLRNIHAVIKEGEVMLHECL